MKVHVLLYKDSKNPKGIPGEWPAVCKRVEDGTKVFPPWIEMSKAEYDAYCLRHQSKYHQWELANGHRKEMPKEEPKKENKNLFWKLILAAISSAGLSGAIGYYIHKLF